LLAALAVGACGGRAASPASNDRPAISDGSVGDGPDVLADSGDGQDSSPDVLADAASPPPSLDGASDAWEGGDASESDALTIVSTIPADGFSELQTITVIGTNFGVTTGATQITIGDVQVLPENMDLAHSSETELIFTVPPLPGLPPAGAPLSLTISNGRTSASVTRTFFPAVLPLQGDITVRFVGATPSTLVAGQSMFFQFDFISNASKSATFALTTILSEPTWHAIVANASHVPLPSSALTMGPGTASFWVEVDPSDSAAATFTLAVQAFSSPLQAGTGLLTFSTGETVTPPDNSTVTLDLQDVELGPTSTFDGATLSSKVGGMASFIVRSAFVDGGTFNSQVQQLAGASGWMPTLTSALPAPVPAGTVRTIGFSVQPAAGATGGLLEFDLVDAQNNVVKSVSIAARITP
jgi:hypothetical protein